MTEKKLVFISHITEESELAQIISNEIKSSFLGLLDTFVSSDGESLPAGGRWLEKIDAALSNSAIQISLCSPQSVKRPWINFEAGASWIRRIPVVPLCHSGLSKSELPVPLSMLQAANLTSTADLQVVFKELTRVLGAAKTPVIDYDGLVGKSEVFIKNYTYFNTIRDSVNLACRLETSLAKLFKSGDIQSLPVKVPDHLYAGLVPALDSLRNFDLLSYSFPGIGVGSDGPFKQGNVTLTSKYLTEILPILSK